MPETLPHSPEAERAVLGVLLVATPETFPELEPDDFYRDTHRAVFTACRELHRRGKPLDLPLVLDELKTRGADVQPDALGDLLTDVSRATNLAHYVDIVRRRAVQRRVIRDCHELAAVAAEDNRGDHIPRLAETMPARWAIPTESTAEIRDLHDPALEAIHPSWIVRDFLPEHGLTMLWAPPGAGKTYALLSLVHQLGCEPGATTLWGHPDLVVERGIRRCLWVSAEERAGEIRTRADRIVSGLDAIAPRGLIRHVYARERHRRVWLTDLDDLIAREDPVDLVVLDSLTGLRPREIDGRRIAWDVDNDATSILSDLLIDLYTRWRTSIVLVHHTGRDLARAATGPGYRGPTEWWATVHAMWGLMPDPLLGEGALKVQIDKMRNGRHLPHFRVQRYHEQGRCWIDYQGTSQEGLGAPAEQILAYMRGAGMASHTQIQETTGLARSSVKKHVAELIEAGLLYDTGNTSGRSPIVAVPAARDDRPDPRNDPSGPARNTTPDTTTDTHNSTDDVPF